MYGLIDTKRTAVTVVIAGACLLYVVLSRSQNGVMSGTGTAREIAVTESRSFCKNDERQVVENPATTPTSRKSADQFMLMMQGMAGIGPKDSRWVSNTLFHGFIAAPMPCCGEPDSKGADDEHACCDRQRSAIAISNASPIATKAYSHFRSQFGGAFSNAELSLLNLGIAPSRKYQSAPLKLPPDGFKAGPRTIHGRRVMSYQDWLGEYRRAATVPLPNGYLNYLDEVGALEGSRDQLAAARAMVDAGKTGDKATAARLSVRALPGVLPGKDDLPDGVEDRHYFRISAVNLDIVYNRFGGHDPRGMCYVLDDEIPELRLGAGKFNAGHDPLYFGCGQTGGAPLRLKDPFSGAFVLDAHDRKQRTLTIQPLVIRGSVGETIVIDFTNRLDDPEKDASKKIDLLANLHVRGASYSYKLRDHADAIPVPSPIKTPSQSQPAKSHLRYIITIPDDPSVEGTYYFHSRPLRDGSLSDDMQTMVDQVSHGLFGALIVEPKGSVYLDCEYYDIDGLAEAVAKHGESNAIGFTKDKVHPIDYTITRDNPAIPDDEIHHGYLPVKSGWGAIIVPKKGEPFREYVLLFHDNLQDTIKGLVEPDPRAINYRTEPFSDIFNPGVAGTRPRTLGAQPFAVNDRSMAYSAYTYGDASTPHPRFYVGDRMCYRVVHAGMGDQFHVFHHHAHRWRFQPRVPENGDDGGLPNETRPSKFGRGFHVDKNQNGKVDPGELMDKQPDVVLSTSTRIDSQTLGPAETFDVFMEGGAGGVQRTVGDVLLHCHIINHVTQGMWTYCRIHNTLQLPQSAYEGSSGPLPGLAPLPNEDWSHGHCVGYHHTKPPIAIDSFQLSKMVTDDKTKYPIPNTGPLAGKKVGTGDSVTNALKKLYALIESQLPLQGTPERERRANGTDSLKINRADRWQWDVIPKFQDERGRRLYLGEPFDVAGFGVVHFGAGFPTLGEGIGARRALLDKEQDDKLRRSPRLKFNPLDGRLAYPHLLPNAGWRPPFAPKKIIVMDDKGQMVSPKDRSTNSRSALVFIRDVVAQGAPYLGPTFGANQKGLKFPGRLPDGEPLGVANGSGLVPVEVDRRRGRNPKSVRHYDVVALQLPIDYSTHTGHHHESISFGLPPNPPPSSQKVKFVGKGVTWEAFAGQDNGNGVPTLPKHAGREVYVSKNNTVYWVIDNTETHGVVFLNGPKARRCLSFPTGPEPIPQPRFAADGSNPIGTDPVTGTGGSTVILTAIVKEMPADKRIEFICTQHGVVMNGALVFEPPKPNVDKRGQLFVLRDDVPDIMAGRKPAEPLVIRGNVGDVIDITLTSALPDDPKNRHYSKVGIHTHLVQYDVQGSDGAVAGLNYETSVRPSLRWDSELKRLVPIDAAVSHEEQVHYRWWCDVELGTVYFHDHSLLKDSLPHGLFGANIVEPAGSKYYDPETGHELYVRNLGRITASSGRNGLARSAILVPGKAPAGQPNDFREYVPLFNDVNDSINLRREPILTRIMGIQDGGLSVLDPYSAIAKAKQEKHWAYSSIIHGDPSTPVLRGFVGDPFRIRTEGGGTHEIHPLQLHGHRWRYEHNNPDSTVRDFSLVGVSEAFSFHIDNRAGNRNSPGDYLYGGTGTSDLVGRGKWGLLRLLPYGGKDHTGRKANSGTLTVILDRPATVVVPRFHRFVSDKGVTFVATERVYVPMTQGDDPDATRARHEFSKSLFFRTPKVVGNDDRVWVFPVTVRPLYETDQANAPRDTPFGTVSSGITLFPQTPEDSSIDEKHIKSQGYEQIASRLINSRSGPESRLWSTIWKDDQPIRDAIKRLNSGSAAEGDPTVVRNALNAIINNTNPTAPDTLYEQEAFRAITLRPFVKQLVSRRHSLTESEYRLLNRLLLDAVFGSELDPIVRLPRILGIRSYDSFRGGSRPLKVLADRRSRAKAVARSRKLPRTGIIRGAPQPSMKGVDDEFYVVALDVTIPLESRLGPTISVDATQRNASNVWATSLASSNGEGSPVRVIVNKGDEIILSTIDKLEKHGLRFNGNGNRVATMNEVPDPGKIDLQETTLNPSKITREGDTLSTKGVDVPAGAERRQIARVRVLRELESPLIMECSVHNKKMEVEFVSKINAITYLQVTKREYERARRDPSYKKVLQEKFRKRLEPMVLRSSAPGKGIALIGIHLLNLLPTKADAMNKGFDVTHWTSMTSIHASLVQYAVSDSDGSAIGNNPHSLVRPGETRDYLWKVDRELGVCLLRDMADPIHQELGMFGALIVEPPGATASNSLVSHDALPFTGCQSMIRTADPSTSFREVVIFLHDNWRLGGQAINFQSALGYGEEPPTPKLLSHSGDPVVLRLVHAAGRGALDNHSFFVDERRWPFDFPTKAILDKWKRLSSFPSNRISAVSTSPVAAYNLFLGKNQLVRKPSRSFYGSGVGRHLAKGGEWGEFVVLPKSDVRIHALPSTTRSR